MGTNYYRIPTKEEMVQRRYELVKKIQSLDTSPYKIGRLFRNEKDDSFDYTDPWEDFIDGVRVHLGKSSMGWKFCWNFHDKKYYSNKVELINFIKNGRVIDEYGVEMDCDEFIEFALNWGQPDGLVYGEEYVKKYELGLPFKPMFDTIIDGLRVSASTEFS